MKADTTCARARVELSARLDGEADAGAGELLANHLAACSACRAHEVAIAQARRAVRTRPAEDVPDLVEPIMQRIREEPLPNRRSWRGRVRVASLSAAASALLVMGTSLPWGERPRQSAQASDIARELRAAAVEIDHYRASFDVVEHGWHPRVDTRRFSVDIAFDAPEKLRLSIRDRTNYPAPGLWPRNDVELVAGGRRWWIREPSACPQQALPACSAPSELERRLVVARQPFDGSTSLPTDIVIPIETVAASRDLEIVGTGRVLSRTTHRVALPYRHAAPLVRSLQVGGHWREIHPDDRVEIWLDARTWFPLGFEVTAGRSIDRGKWAVARGYRDRPGELLLGARATSFATPGRLPPALFRPPRSGIVRHGGFRAAELSDAWWAPRDLAGLRPYRSGTTPLGQQLLAYSDGMMWLKVLREPSRPTRWSSAEEIRLRDGSYAYYEPANATFKRRVEIHAPRAHFYLESNLAKGVLLRVAASLPVVGERLPRRLRAAGGTIVRIEPSRLRRHLLGRSLPSVLFDGHRLSSASLTRSRNGSRSLTVIYRRSQVQFDGEGIRITLSAPADMLLPSSEDLDLVRVAPGIRGRWSAARAELELIYDGRYLSVAAPSFDLSAVVQIARSLL